MDKHILGVSFDLDGTFYPSYRYYLRIIPFMLRYPLFLAAFGRTRKVLRKIEWEGSLYDKQAEIIGGILRKDPGVIKERIERQIYRGWEPLFKRIKLFPHVRETLWALKERGFKLGLLSDFPPEAKLRNLGLGAPLWDTVLCSEITNRLKPDISPFQKLIGEMSLPGANILYVGNSVDYDIQGAKNAGLQAALVCSPLRRLSRNAKKADFVFSDYRQLLKFVLNYEK
jgi:putative hydrolase of the HAD superfamily